MITSFRIFLLQTNTFNLLKIYLSDGWTVRNVSFFFFCTEIIIIFLWISTGLIPIKLSTRLFHKDDHPKQSIKVDYNFGKFKRGIHKLAEKKGEKTQTSKLLCLNGNFKMILF